MKQTQRSKRLGELIQRTLANVLLYYRDNPLLIQVTLVGVDVAPDLSIAKIFVSILNEDNVNAVMNELQREAGHLRYQLAHKLNLRVTPRLHFVYDYSISKGQKLSAIIDSAVESDEATRPPENIDNDNNDE